MPTLSFEDSLDLVVTTQRQLDKGKFTDNGGTLQKYHVMKHILNEKKKTEDGGYGLEWSVMYTTSGAAQNVGLFQVDNYNVGDVMTKGNIPWRNTNTNYSIDEHEVSANAGPSKIIDLVKIRRADAMLDLAKKFEADFWSKPVDSTDKVTPFGLDYWVVRNATEGFNGGAASGFTSGPGNISPTTYPTWKNWTAQYTNVTKDDLIAKMRKASAYTDFESPISVEEARKVNSMYSYYTNYDVLGTLETLLENQNENLGNDLASKDGFVQFKKNPVKLVQTLDADAQDPVYGINWNVLFPVFLKGWYMKEAKARMSPKQHNVIVTDVDNTYNYKCTDRRRLFVCSKA